MLQAHSELQLNMRSSTLCRNRHSPMDGQSGNDVMYGGAGNDWMVGGWGNDFLDGGDGIDLISGTHGTNTIIGGAGNDWLFGGSGNDTFVFGPGSGVDTIWKFNDTAGNTDRIDLSGYTDITDFSDLDISQYTNWWGRTMTVIKLDEENKIYLYNYQMNDLDATDFIFNGDEDAYYGG